MNIQTPRAPGCGARDFIRWEPSIRLRRELAITYRWIEPQITASATAQQREASALVTL